MTTAVKEKNYRRELFEIEPKIDFLHEISGFGRFSAVVRTSDGFFLGQPRGHAGFNDFLGMPGMKALTRTKKILEELSAKNRDIAKAILRRFRIFM